MGLRGALLVGLLHHQVAVRVWVFQQAEGVRAFMALILMLGQMEEQEHLALLFQAVVVRQGGVLLL
jgi:hypothetical protein